MRIEGPSNRMPVTRRRVKSDSGFSVSEPEQNEISSSQNTKASQPVSELDSILALQAVEDPLLAKKRAVRHGASLLDALDEIKADVLTGQIGEGRIHRLAALISRARDLSEPELDSILDEIELRARVELAKLGR